MRMARTGMLAFAVLAGLTSFADAQPGSKKPEEPSEVSYYKHIRPIVQLHCQGCHQPAKPQGGYIMTSYADLVKPGMSSKPAIVAGKPADSHIIAQLTPQGDKRPAMPKDKEPLLDYDINLIKKWIAQGAKDDTPASAKLLVDEDHPPVYVLPPVITALDYSPDGGLLAVSAYHEVLLYNADGSSLIARLIGLSERVQSLAFSPDGRYLAVSGGSPGLFGEVQVWDISRPRLNLPFVGDTIVGSSIKTRLRFSVSVTFDTVYGVSWSPDGSKIAFGCGDNTIRAIDSTNGQQVLFQGAHGDWVMDTVFSTDGNYLISVSRDQSVKMTEVVTQRFVDNVTSITPGALKGGLLTVARRPRKDNRMVVLPPDNPDKTPKRYDEVLVAGADGTPRIYKIHRETKRVIGDDANKVRDFGKLPGRVFAAEFDPTGARFVVGSSLDGRGEIRIYDANDGKQIAKLDGQHGPVYTLAYCPDGKQIASGGFDGIVRLNDAKTGKLIKEFVAMPVGGDKK